MVRGAVLRAFFTLIRTTPQWGGANIIILAADVKIEMLRSSVICQWSHSLGGEEAGFDSRWLSTRVHALTDSIHSPSLNLSSSRRSRDTVFVWLAESLSGWMNRCYNPSKLSSEFLQYFIFFDTCDKAWESNHAPWKVPLTSLHLCFSFPAKWE